MYSIINVIFNNHLPLPLPPLAPLPPLRPATTGSLFAVYVAPYKTLVFEVSAFFYLALFFWSLIQYVKITLIGSSSSFEYSKFNAGQNCFTSGCKRHSSNQAILVSKLNEIKFILALITV